MKRCMMLLIRNMMLLICMATICRASLYSFAPPIHCFVVPHCGQSVTYRHQLEVHCCVLFLLQHAIAMLAYMSCRGHKVVVVTTSPAAIGYLQRASARHTSNTTAEAMQYIAAEAAAPVAAQGAAMAAAPGTSSQATAGVPTADRTREEQAAMQSQQQGRSSKTAAAAQQTWKGEIALSAACRVSSLRLGVLTSGLTCDRAAICLGSCVIVT